MVELLRAVAAFMIAPVFVYLAGTIGDSLAEGTRAVLWISLAVVVVGTAFAAFVYVAGGARPQTPQMTTFLDGDAPAWDSPPLFARLRRRAVVEDVVPDDDLPSLAVEESGTPAR